MYYRELYGEKWVEEFKRYVKTVVEPFYGEPIEVDEAELRDAVERSRRIPGYSELSAVVNLLAVVSKDLVLVSTLLDTVFLRDGTGSHILDHVSAIVEKALEGSSDRDKIKRRLNAEIGVLFSIVSDRLKFLLEQAPLT